MPGARESWLIFGAAFLSILVVAGINSFFLSGKDVPIIVASMGASALLLFAVPHSRLLQPWPFVGGHLVSATIGVCCAQWIPDQVLAVAVATATAIICMLYLHCLHPPGGAAALMAVAANRFILGRDYPAKPKAPRKTPLDFQSATDAISFSDSDLDQALKDMKFFIDVSKEDLNAIYALARMHHQKKSIRRDKMS